MALPIDFIVVGGLAVLAVVAVVVLFSRVSAAPSPAVKPVAGGKAQKRQARKEAPAARKAVAAKPETEELGEAPLTASRARKDAAFEAALVNEAKAASPAAPVSKKAAAAAKKAAKARAEARAREEAEIDALIARDLQMAQQGMAKDRAAPISLEDYRAKQAAKMIKAQPEMGGSMSIVVEEEVTAKDKASGFKVIDPKAQAAAAAAKSATAKRRERHVTQAQDIDAKLDTFFKAGGARQPQNRKSASPRGEEKAEAKKDGGRVTMQVKKFKTADPEGFWSKGSASVATTA